MGREMMLLVCHEHATEHATCLWRHHRAQRLGLALEALLVLMFGCRL